MHARMRVHAQQEDAAVVRLPLAVFPRKNASR